MMAAVLADQDQPDPQFPGDQCPEHEPARLGADHHGHRGSTERRGQRGTNHAEHVGAAEHPRQVGMAVHPPEGAEHQLADRCQVSIVHGAILRQSSSGVAAVGRYGHGVRSGAGWVVVAGPWGEWSGRPEWCASHDCANGASAFLAGLWSAPPSAQSAPPRMLLSVVTLVSATRSDQLSGQVVACHTDGVRSRGAEHSFDIAHLTRLITTHVGWRAMGDRSTIEWTEATWNPVTGCDRVSPGCDHCYALTLAARLKAMGSPKYQQDGDPRTSGPGFGVTLHPDELVAPRRWRRPRRVFVNSMSDLFHPRVPVEFIAEVFAMMAETPQHTYQVLTKRPKRARSVLRDLNSPPLRNVWVGVSVEDEERTDRVAVLRETLAAVRFLSCEPLLGPLSSLDLAGIDWVIVGGESGAEARPMREAWVTEIRDNCLDTGIPFFFKQWGGRTPKAGGRRLAGRTWDEMPQPEAADGEQGAAVVGLLDRRQARHSRQVS
jgi:protein gp37